VKNYKFILSAILSGAALLFLYGLLSYTAVVKIQNDNLFSFVNQSISQLSLRLTKLESVFRTNGHYRLKKVYPRKQKNPLPESDSRRLGGNHGFLIKNGKSTPFD